jgi:hypothetical protein
MLRRLSIFLLSASLTLRGAELKAHCTHCHGEEEKPEAGVDLRLRRFMDKELDGGARVLVPGQPDQSEMVLLIREGEMPKKGKKLAAEQLATIEKWIAQGAKAAKPEPETLAHGMLITDDDREWWSFRPIVRPAVPAESDHPIDAFVRAKLREQQLDFAPPADQRTLLRRVTLDLTGLPPTPEELEAFLADTAPDAYEKVVDRLLGSLAYAERWARHWLDVAGYADSNGFMEADSPRLHAWRYRDYVIRMMNADMPWNRFLLEQQRAHRRGPAGARVVDHLRARQRVAGPARLHGARASRRAADLPGRALHQWLAARALPGHAHPADGAAHSESRSAGGARRARAAAATRPFESDERSAPSGASGRARSPGAHRELRARGKDADRGEGSARYFLRARAREATLRRR